MYRLGFTPWDRMMPAELADIVSGPNALPPGRALDMGSGRGTKAVFVAPCGGHVTAIGAVPRASEDALRRAEKAGVQVDFRRGDVTHLEALQLQPGYKLVFDFGCFHGLSRRGRDAYAGGVDALTRPGSTLLMMAFTRAVPPIVTPVTEAELLQRFAGWKLAWTHSSGGDVASTAARRGAAGWFCLVKQ